MPRILLLFGIFCLIGCSAPISSSTTTSTSTTTSNSLSTSTSTSTSNSSLVTSTSTTSANPGSSTSSTSSSASSTSTSSTTTTTVIIGPVNGEITFAGYTWDVKSSSTKVGPGPNYFGGATDNIWVDQSGQLHLKITYSGGKWYCAEIVCKNSFGFGKYIFYAASRLDNIDENIVVGLFTWDDSPSYNNREIDIEFARWGDDSWPNLNYTVQPYTTTSNYRATTTDYSGINSTHFFNWQSSSIIFQSIKGLYATAPDSSYLIDSWTSYSPDIPPEGNEHPRINLWLMNGLPPAHGTEVEFIIKDFEFIP